LPANCPTKEFYVSANFLVNWRAAISMCYNYGLKFASLDTATEATQFLAMAKANPTLFTAQTYLGGAHLAAGDMSTFSWVATNQPIGQTIAWASGEPNDPKMYCLAMQKLSKVFTFIDSPCDDQSLTYKFVCQK